MLDRFKSDWAKTFTQLLSDATTLKQEQQRVAVGPRNAHFGAAALLLLPPPLLLSIGNLMVNN